MLVSGLTVFLNFNITHDYDHRSLIYYVLFGRI